MANHKELGDELDDEVSTILSSGFTIDVVKTSTVPHSYDPAITFPNLDAETQGAKMIETCVLYIDIRRSTDLNLEHRAPTVAKLYSAFIRAMTKTARYYNGHVRGIIGDRLMVLFDVKDCHINAVHCAVAMKTVGQYIVNKHFKPGEVKFGIGIDFGRMLATKTGIRRHGDEQHNYRNLVWLGRPANVASKLTDIAGKPSESNLVTFVEVAYKYPSLSTGLLGNVRKGTYSSTAHGWQWYTQTPKEFLEDLETKFYPSHILHKDRDYEAFYPFESYVQTKPVTPVILMTAPVWNGFKKTAPTDNLVTTRLVSQVKISVPGYSRTVYGTDAIFPSLKI